MKIYGKILLATLPLVLLAFLVAGGITYYLSRDALTHIAEQWLETRGLEALEAAREQAEFLKAYGLDSVDASILQAQNDAAAAMATIRIGERGYIFVIDAAGSIVHHPDPALVGVDVSGESWFAKMKSAAQGRVSYILKGQPHLATFHSFDTWKWIVVATDPEAEVYGAVNKLGTYVLVLGVVGSGLMALVLMVLTRRVTAPLRSLVEGAQRVGRGQLDTKITVDTHDEIGLLAGAFNEMTDQLRALYNRLEERLTTVVSNAPIILFSLDHEGQFTLLEGKGLEALGFHSDEIIGQPVSKVFAEAPEILRAVNAALQGETVNSIATYNDLIFEVWCSSMIDTTGSGPGVIGVATDITERRQAEEKLRRQAEYLAALNETTLGIVSRLDPEDLLEALITRAGHLLDAPHGFIFLAEEGVEEIRRKVGVGVYKQSIGYRLKPGKGVAGRVWQSGTPLVVNDYDTWEERIPNPKFDGFIRAVVGVPLKSDTQTVGVLGMAYDAGSGRIFGDEEMEVLGRFAELASISLDNARLYVAAQEAMRRSEKANERVIKQNRMPSSLSTQLSKYLSPQVYSSIFSGEQSVEIASKRKKLTIFFSDIANFTKTTESLESEELTDLLNHYLTEMSKIALDHGAAVDKYIGDAILAFFGDPDSQGVKEDATACVKMAIAMQRRMRELQSEWLERGSEEPFRLRIGINTGFCTVGNFGSEDRMDYTIIGNAVNLAARLQSHAELGGILIAHETFSLVKDSVLAEEQEAISIKGFSKPVRTYKVAGIYDDLTAEGRIIHHRRDAVEILVDLEKLSDSERAKAIEAVEDVLSKLKT